MKKVLIVYLTGIMFISLLFPTGAWAAEPVYQAGSMAELENVIFNAIKSREKSFKVRFLTNTVNVKGDIKTARDNAVVREPYEEGSIGLISGFKISSYTGYADISFDSFQYFTTKEQEQFVDQEVERITAKLISDKMNDHAKVKAIHEYIINQVDYDYSLAGYTAYSALTKGVTVCNGYVQLAYRLLNRIGIETKIVKGTLELNGTVRDHAWLLVKIDGSWFHLDPTLNDTLSGSGSSPYKYYNLSDAEILVDHRFSQLAYPAAPNKYQMPAKNGGNSGDFAGYFSEKHIANKVVAALDKARALALIESSDANRVLYELELKSKGNNFEIKIPIEVFSKLANKNQVGILRVKTSIGWYDVPAEGIVSTPTPMVMKEPDANLIITISKLEGSVAKDAARITAKAGLKLASDPIRFILEVERNGVREQVSLFSKFVVRSIVLQRKIDVDGAVGLLYIPETGEIRPVPAVFSDISGKVLTRLHLRENGIFLVAVDSRKQFADLKKHRDPKRKVTRAEFAAVKK